MKEAPAHVAGEDHWAGGAEQIAGGHNGHDEEATPVDGCEDRSEIPRRELRTEEAVEHDRDCSEQQDDLQYDSRMAPPQECTEEWEAQDVHALRSRTDAVDLDLLL